MSETTQNYVKVLEEYAASLDSDMQVISDNMENISTEASSIFNIISEGTWEGESRDKCVQVYNKLFAYYSDVDNCYRDLKNAITNLITHVDSFKDDSTEVQKLF